MIHYNPEFSGSVTGTQATVSLSGSFTGSGTIENANTASRLVASASFGLGMEAFNFDGSTNQIISIDTSSVHFISGALEAIGGAFDTSSLLKTASISGLTQSFTKGDGSTFELLLPDTGSVDLVFSMSNGLGIETFSFDNTANAFVQVDTSSAHFLDPINAATASLSASASTSRDGIANAVSGAFDTVSASLAGDITTNSSSAATALTNLSSSASTAREAISSSLATDLATVSASNAALSASASTARESLSGSASTARDVLASQVSGAFADVSASLSASIAALSASNSTAREDYYHSSSLLPGREEDTLRLFKGSGVDNVTFVTRSFVKTVNGQGPNSVGNVSTTLTAVDTGTSASMLAKSSSGGFDNGEVWIISGESGSLTGSNGRAFIYDSGSGQLYELSNLSEAENDARYVLKAGDTMTGNLVLPAVNPTLANEATRKAYVDLFYDSSSIDAANSELEFHKGDNVTVDIISLAGITVSGSTTASLALRVEESLDQGLGIETFTYDGDTAGVIVQLDTSSAHFTVGVSASQASTLTTLSASFSTSQTALSSSASTARQSLSGSASTAREFYITTASISGLTQSFTKGDGTSFSLNLPDTGSVDLVFSMSNGLGIETFTFDNTANASVQVNTASFHVANITASLLQTASNGLYTMSFTKGDTSTFDIPISASEYAITSSHALTASIVSGMSYRENVTGATSYTINHNLDERYPVVQTYDTNTNVMIIPSEVTASSDTSLDIKFASTFTGIVIVHK